MKINVYIDGFNLFYGSVKGTPYKWLDIDKMCRLLLPNHQINKIKYFTALVNARPNDLNQPVRQLAYLRALETIPHLEIVIKQIRKGVLAASQFSPTMTDKQGTFRKPASW